MKKWHPEKEMAWSGGRGGDDSNDVKGALHMCKSWGNTNDVPAMRTPTVEFTLRTVNSQDCQLTGSNDSVGCFANNKVFRETEKQ